MLKNRKKVIASSIAATMILGMVPNNIYADFVSKDIQNHWAKSQICVMQEKGYIGGYPDGTFKPNKAITRQEAASVIAKIKNLAPSKNSRKTDSFTDKDKIAKWSKSGIDAVVERGYMSGYPDGTFRPNQPMTRAEVVALLSRFLDSKNSDQTQIKNNEEIKPKVEAKTDATTNSSRSGGNSSSSSSNNSNNKVNPFSNKGTFNSNYELSTSDSVTYGNNTFENCTGLTEIVIPNSVTSIGERTFEGCSELKVIKIDNIKENVVLGEKCIPKNVEIRYLRAQEITPISNLELQTLVVSDNEIV